MRRYCRSKEEQKAKASLVSRGTPHQITHAHARYLRVLLRLRREGCLRLNACQAQLVRACVCVGETSTPGLLKLVHRAAAAQPTPPSPRTGRGSRAEPSRPAEPEGYVLTFVESGHKTVAEAQTRGYLCFEGPFRVI